MTRRALDSMNQQTHRQALPKGYMLQEYQVDRVLGAGGFGLTYLGWDTALEKPVAVKEYLPNDLAVREANHSVAAKSRDDEDNFRWGLTRFLDEARTLARFKHPNIVPVHRCFEAHGTAYIVMEFVEGETFGAYLKRAGKPKESFLRAVLFALLDGLAEVHRAGFMHRDIKPGNILLNAKGVPVLVDFGSARQEIGGRSRSITSVVTPGYAPIEQYSSRGNQGPWTDIYALGAVAYRAITGETPPDATERVRKDPMTSATDAARGKYSAKLLAAVDWALAVDEDKRPQDVDAWRDVLTDESRAQKPAVAAPPAKPEVKPEIKRNVEAKKSSGMGWVAVIFGVFVVGGLGVDWAEWNSQRAAEESAVAKLTPKCNEPTKSGDAACWREVANRPGCYLWDWNLGNNESSDWSGQCKNGMVDGRGEEIWRSDGDTGTGSYANGKRQGHWVFRFADGYVEEIHYVNGKQHGQALGRYANGDVAEVHYVNGKRHGQAVRRFADGDVAEVHFVDDKLHGQYVKRNADGDVVERRCFENGDEIDC